MWTFAASLLFLKLASMALLRSKEKTSAPVSRAIWVNRPIPHPASRTLWPSRCSGQPVVEEALSAEIVPHKLVKLQLVELIPLVAEGRRIFVGRDEAGHRTQDREGRRALGAPQLTFLDLSVLRAVFLASRHAKLRPAFRAGKHIHRFKVHFQVCPRQVGPSLQTSCLWTEDAPARDYCNLRGRPKRRCK